MEKDKHRVRWVIERYRDKEIESESLRESIREKK